MSRRLLAALFAILLAVTGCSGSAGESSVAPGADPTAMIADGATVVDVRTPEEYAEGHLDGAINVDWNGADFDAQIAELPKDEAIVVYCRSGNRSGQAMARMQELGFTNITNGGAYESLR